MKLVSLHPFLLVFLYSKLKVLGVCFFRLAILYFACFGWLSSSTADAAYPFLLGGMDLSAYVRPRLFWRNVFSLPRRFFTVTVLLEFLLSVGAARLQIRNLGDAPGVVRTNVSCTTILKRRQLAVQMCSCFFIKQSSLLQSYANEIVFSLRF